VGLIGSLVGLTVLAVGHGLWWVAAGGWALLLGLSYLINTYAG
jgi:hypothetical protein